LSRACVISYRHGVLRDEYLLDVCMYYKQVATSAAIDLYTHIFFRPEHSPHNKILKAVKILKDVEIPKKVKFVEVKIFLKEVEILKNRVGDIR
jgi:hypothetical protein